MIDYDKMLEEIALITIDQAKWMISTLKYYKCLDDPTRSRLKTTKDFKADLLSSCAKMRMLIREMESDL